VATFILTTIHFVRIEDDEVGEVEGVFDASNKLLDFWALNDANWRSEYFSGFMEKLGFKTNYRLSASAYKKLQKALKAAAKEAYGL
jgi:hypothetical protein